MALYAETFMLPKLSQDFVYGQKRYYSTSTSGLCAKKVLLGSKWITIILIYMSGRAYRKLGDLYPNFQV